MRSRIRVPAMVCLAISACSDAPTDPPSVAQSTSEVTAPAILARITQNTIDPTGTVTRNGHHITLTGPIECTGGESASLRVTLTQRATAAMAEGHGRITCTGSPQTWRLQLSTAGSETFQEGDATAVAVARTTDRGKLTDAHQWLVNITLVE